MDGLPQRAGLPEAGREVVVADGQDVVEVGDVAGVAECCETVGAQALVRGMPRGETEERGQGLLTVLDVEGQLDVQLVVHLGRAR